MGLQTKTHEREAGLGTLGRRPEEWGPWNRAYKNWDRVVNDSQVIDLGMKGD